MKRRKISIVCLAALVIGFAGAAAAQERGCSNASLRGTWAYTETGSVIAPTQTGGTVTILAAAVGTYTFDNEGNFTGDQFSSAAGAVGPDTKVGSYTVNPDCTGTLDLVASRGGVPQRHSVWFIVIADNGQELRSIMTSMVALPSGATLSPIMTMTAKKLFAGRADGQ